jgi:DNA-directed RNA polymerase specialized sigma24 family protein
MDTHHVAPHPLPKPRLKRVQRFSHFALEPGDEELISQLPELHRSMLALSGSYQEIGQKLNLPGGTVRSRLHRARAALVKMREARHS